jgi:hypothetical protein
MSFFEEIKRGLKKVKNGLTSPNMSFAVLLPKETYFLGEDIEGAIVLQPNEYVEVQQALVKLSCIERVKKTRQLKKSKRTYDSDRQEYVVTEEFVPEEYWDTAQLYNKALVYNLGYYVNTGDNRRTPFKINVPLTGRPTFNSVNSNVDWNLSVELRSKGRRNLNQLYRVQVANVPTPPSQATQIPIVQKETIREIEVIYCSHCGTKNNARSTHCAQCGAPLR